MWCIQFELEYGVFFFFFLLKCTLFEETDFDSFSYLSAEESLSTKKIHVSSSNFPYNVCFIIDILSCYKLLCYWIISSYILVVSLFVKRLAKWKMVISS